jgi:hypothetical protein
LLWSLLFYFTFRESVLETTLTSTSDGRAQGRDNHNILGRLDANLVSGGVASSKVARYLLETRSHVGSLFNEEEERRKKKEKKIGLVRQIPSVNK